MSKINILLIEDNPDDAQAIIDVLKKHIKQLSVKHLEDFHLFKEVIRHKNYDLILSEQDCGEFTGIDIIKVIRSKDIVVPVILLTRKHSIENSLAALELHVDDYLVKNETYIERLPNVIDRVLKNAHLEEIKRKNKLKLNSTLNEFINIYENNIEILQSIWLDGSFINVNNSWRNVLEYNNYEINDINIKSIVDKAWQPEIDEVLNEIKSGKEKIHAELGLITKSNKKIIVDCYINTRMENRRPVASNWVMRDITEEKQTEDLLCDINDQYLSMFENFPNPMVLGDHRGRVLQINQAACDLVGYTYKEMIGKHIREITHPMDILKSLYNHKKLLSGLVNNYRINKRYRHKEGHYVEVEVTAGLIRNGEGQPRLGIAEFRKLD